GRSHGGFLAAGQAGSDLRYSVAGEHLSGFGRAEPVSLRRAIQEGSDERSRVGTPQVTELGDAAGLSGPPGAIPAGVRQRAGGARGVGVGGDRDGARRWTRPNPE